MSLSQPKILVVDDEESLCEILQFNLELEGFHVDVAYSAEQALAMPLSDYQLLLLDVMMGATSGFRMAQRLRQNPVTAKIPIIFCTAKDTEDDTVAGFSLGADDYIAKPFSVREVVARVKAVLRRTAVPSALTLEGLQVDLLTKECSVDGQAVTLSYTEFELLAYLMQHGGRIISRDEIMDNVWGPDVIVTDRTIDVNINRLRKKLGPCGTHIITRQGYGYGFKK